MDYTKIINDGEGIEEVPQCVLDLLSEAGLDYSYSSRCVRTSDEDGRTTFEVGIKDAGENLNEAPYLVGDYSYMIDAMEKFKAGDDEGADEAFVRLMNDVPEVSRARDDTRRDPISRAETNAEMCLFNVRDLEAEAQSWGYKGLAMLNPSVGTVKRYTQIYPKSSIPIYITEVDSDYVRRISNLCDSLKLAPPNCLPVVKLQSDVIYYMGYRADKIFEYNSERLQRGLDVLVHIGFVPNLLAMSCANVDILSYSENDKRFVYLRKNEEISVNLQQHVSVVRADALTHDFAKLKHYKRTQGILHDLVSSLEWKVDVPIIKARPIPVGILVPKYSGPINKRHDGIFINNHCVVDSNGMRIDQAWKIPVNLADHRYMTGEYHGAIYDAGRVVRVTRAELIVKKYDRYVEVEPPGSLKHKAYDANQVGMRDAYEKIMGHLQLWHQLPIKGNIFKDDKNVYVEDDKGDIRLRENRNGNVRQGNRRFNKEVVSQYVISVETAIQYSGDRLEMYGVEYVDMTTGNLEISGVAKSEGAVEFGSIG